ncbi:MAG TPA: bifunctional tRNA (5-methylaminomethyl-2-thiouridine)(34)-methyltransferase MnmD/FAD-dependent 5-carboxymethylaminomethyl-2-thiouridine(34) oxidoreductase MnmC [Candidatus Binatia bacterium]|nr:bifunctional tRNA (5-methylaminomethyl-2-thiouridine)(34)-methyltransferase MnmD/FAD-dependent 5-carboxymethylaminomethyl-2-thiouridine(34) oxidoreductase MnmC [Candidatus Binatia bacterium]
MPRLPPLPRLEWSEAGAPRAAEIGDVYFSDAGGLAESEHVFLQGTGLPDAWRGRDRFAICELGFGSGLNVLAAWRAWKATRAPHATLHISSIEAFPLAKADAERALARFPEVAALAQALLARWPVRAYAPQRIWFEDDRFALTLFVGEAEQVLAGMRGAFDAWFLDGFAPSRNPAMWTPEVLRQVARLSAPSARAATFSVAGDVRRGLKAAGFGVEKKSGYGGKRERLEARLETPPPSLAKSGTGSHNAGGGTGASNIYPYAAAHPKRVAIIGAGIAGAACARALVRRGVETIVLEGARELGAGASGNPAGLVMPRLDRGPLSELFLAAYLHAVAAYEALGVFDACGVEQRAEASKQTAFFLQLNDPPLPDDWLVELAHDVALHRRAGVVRPCAAVEGMLRGAQVQFEAEVQSLDRSGEGWVLRADDGRAMLKADAVVLACGAALTRFAPASFLPITLSCGQIEWGEGARLDRALVRGNYVAPFEGGVLFGATFDHYGPPASSPVSAAPAVNGARARNIAALSELAPDIAASIDPAKLHSRASLRATTPDRLPIAGLLPDAPAWFAQYEALAHGRKIETDQPPPAHRGVYVIGGLGARGLTFAPLLGERIASEICGEPAPLSQFSLDAIHPARFLHRALKRR